MAMGQPRRPATAKPREKAAAKQQQQAAAPTPAAMDMAEAPAVAQEGEEVVVDMEVDAKRAKGRKPRTASRVKKSGAPFAPKKQKAAKK
jgi:hypothetical protein